MTELAFVGVAVISVALALVVVLARRLLFAAVSLMGVLATTAVVYVMLGADFLAGMQILVYVAGTVVVIVFAIMLTQSPELVEPRPTAIRRFTAALVTAVFAGMTLGVLWTTDLLPQGTMRKSAETTQLIGNALLNAGTDGFVIPLELISILLLAALIGGIVLARSGNESKAGGGRS